MSRRAASQAFSAPAQPEMSSESGTPRSIASRASGPPVRRSMAGLSATNSYGSERQAKRSGARRRAAERIAIAGPDGPERLRIGHVQGDASAGTARPLVEGGHEDLGPEDRRRAAPRPRARPRRPAVRETARRSTRTGGSFPVPRRGSWPRRGRPPGRRGLCRAWACSGTEGPRAGRCRRTASSAASPASAPPRARARAPRSGRGAAGARPSSGRAGPAPRCGRRTSAWPAGGPAPPREGRRSGSGGRAGPGARRASRSPPARGRSWPRRCSSGRRHPAGRRRGASTPSSISAVGASDSGCVPVETVDRETTGAVAARGHGDHVLRSALESVLGPEQRGQRQPRAGRDQARGPAQAAVHGRLVRDQPDPRPREPPGTFLEKDLEPGPDSAGRRPGHDPASAPGAAGSEAGGGCAARCVRRTRWLAKSSSTRHRRRSE